MKIFTVLMFMFVSGCLIPVSDTFPIEYEFNDLPDQRRIELKYVNKSHKTVCLLPEMWPDITGEIDGASDRMFLIIQGKKYPIIDMNSGNCVGDCSERVAPGNKIVAFIPYEFFNIPEDLIEEKKELDFFPVAYFCRPK